MVKKSEKLRYMLIDGNALVHRGFHAIPGLTVSKTGEAIGAVFGFTSILLRAIKDLKPTHIACTFDLAGPTFRHEQYEDYKATRVKAAPELYEQIPKAKEVIKSLGIPIFEKEGFEADDCLGTLATHIYKMYYPSLNPSPHEGRGRGEVEIMIVTGDLDTLQLVNGSIKVYTLRKGLSDTAVYGAKEVFERYGLTPEQMVDFKALRGDPSDNIKGVKGIGEKGAIDLIQKFGSIENLYKEIKSGGSKVKDIKPRVLQLLIDGEEAARQSFALSKIVLDVPLKIKIDPFVFGSKELSKIAELFKQYEFKSLMDKLPKGYEARGQATEESEQREIKQAETNTDSSLSPKTSNLIKQDYVFVDTEEKLEKVLSKLEKTKSLVLDTESTSIDAIKAELVGVSLAIKEGQAFYVPARLVLKSPKLCKLLESKVLEVGHNIKYDFLVLKKAGILLGGEFFDTMVASYLLNSSTRQHSLDTLAFNELGYQMQPIEELIGKGKSQITMDQVEPEKVSWYACEDADMTLRLKDIFETRLKKEGLEKLFLDIEMPLVRVLANMEENGIKLDSKLLNSLSKTAEKDIEKLEQEIYELSGEEFNISSPKQLKEVLFDKLQLSSEGNRKTKTGLSTAAGELEKMLDMHPVIEKILQYRELTKLQSTYLETLPKLVNEQTGRVHTSYNQTIAATGRLSSTDPNLQNIPAGQSGLGAEVRKSFIAQEGFKFLSIDYSQIELRIVAHLAQDKNMLDIFQRGEDIHTATAMEIFNVPSKEVTKDMRRHAKTVNFGILYGLSAFGLSYRVNELARVDAKEYIDKYFEAYPEVKLYIEKIKAEVREQGFIANELGRIRRFPEIQSSQYFIRQAAERAAVNFPIQSLAADVMKVAMINVYKELEAESLKLKADCRMLLQVHDELLFEVKEEKVEHYAKLLLPIMEQAIKLSAPITCEAKVGSNWGEMDKLE